MVEKDGLLVKMQWRIDTDLEALKAELSGFVCDGRYETQHYPHEMCERLLRSLP